LGGDVIEYCELIPFGSGRQWALKE